ncbi:hypothetical protein HU200_053953 [Digitaria exilis]|uniref:Uncharacterized protein n=1 Tax=Digitaria exilis TaxID=1010633 RepID=A0A835AJ96_9POAL|nr:hypothetical protein HU200_053953 [Digitaria exilis]
MRPRVSPCISAFLPNSAGPFCSYKSLTRMTYLIHLIISRHNYRSLSSWMWSYSYVGAFGWLRMTSFSEIFHQIFRMSRMSFARN